MLLLVAVAIGSGLVTAAVLTPISVLAALIIAPLAASVAAILAGLLIAWRGAEGERQTRALNVQADAMVAVLRDVAQQGDAASPVPKVRSSRHRAA